MLAERFVFWKLWGNIPNIVLSSEYPNIGTGFFSKRKERIKGESHSHIPNILGWRAQSLIRKVDTRSVLCFTYGGVGSGWSIINKLIGTVPTWPRFVEIWWEKAMISTQTEYANSTHINRANKRQSKINSFTDITKYEKTAIFAFAALKLTTSKHTEKKTQRQTETFKLLCQRAQQ